MTNGVPRPSFWYATATFVATVVGVGIFGLPYVAAKAGFGVFLLELLVLAIVMHVVDLLYAEVVWKTPGRERFLGYVEHYLGPRWRHALAPVTIASFYGALLAYLIVGGEFLSNLLGSTLGGSAGTYSFVLFLVGGFIVWQGLAAVKRIDFLLVSVVLGLMGVLVVVGLPKVGFENFTLAIPAAALLPYGALLFALTGQSIIPELRELAGEPQVFRRVLVVGAIVVALLYAVFAFVVVGVSGAGTTTEAVEGLKPFLGRGVVALGSVIGTITILGAFASLGITLKRIFSYDYKVRYPFSTILALVPPLLLYWLGVKNFITVIGFIGSVLVGIVVLTTFVLYRKSLEHKETVGLLRYHPGRWVVDGLIILFTAGIVIGIVTALP